WGVPALVRTHGDFFRIGIGRHVVGRSIAPMEGHGANSLVTYLLTLPFYFVTVFSSFFPWSIRFPWLVRRLWNIAPRAIPASTTRNQETVVADRHLEGRDATDNYLVAGIAVTFLVFTLVATKLPHYTLPVFPLLALLLAKHWSRMENAAKTFQTMA